MCTSGQFQHIGQPSQDARQHTTTSWNQQAGTSDTSLLYMRWNNVYSKQNTLHLQTPNGHHQAVNVQQPVGGHTNRYDHKVLQCTLATHQDIHQGSGFISLSSQPSMMKASNIHPQQAMSAHWLSTSRLVSFAAHNNQTAYTGHDRPSCTQNELSPVVPTSYDMAVKSMTNKSMEQILQVSSISQKTQQYSSSLQVTDSSTLEAVHEKYKHQKIARIVDYLHDSCSACSDGCPPPCTNSSYREKQFASKERMTESNQNRPSVTMNASKSHNLSASQSPSLCFRPNSGHSFHFRTQHSAEGAQQEFVPTVLCGTATGAGDVALRQADDTVGKTANEMIPQSNKVVEGNPAGLFPAITHLKKLSAGISQPANETSSFVANYGQKPEMTEIRSSFKLKVDDSLSHSSPGHTATRAVAVVQPLCSDTTNEVPDESLINHSSAFTDGTSVSCSAEHQVISQKHICADDTDSELAMNVQVDQHVALTAQQSITSQVPINPSCDGDKNENPTNPKACYFELSSIPTIPWTTDKLTNLILDGQTAQFKRCSNSTYVRNFSRIINRFWDGSIKNLLSAVEDGCYRQLSECAQIFCRDQVTSETVILSQVEHNFERKLKSHHVLKDNDVYSETPYKSPWLNVNEQLDDIDKEFGFPLSLKRNINGPEKHRLLDQASKVNGNPAQILNEEPNEVLAPKEQLPEPVDSSEEKQPFSDEFTSTQAPSPEETSSDPYYSVEIQVLPPEVAKLIYEQAQYEMQLSKDADSLPDRGVWCSVEDQPSEAADITLNSSRPVKNSVSLKEICCLSKWLEQICGQSSSSSKCQCENEQSLTDSPADAFDQEEMSLQMDDSVSVIMSDSKLLNGENQVKGNESTNSEMEVSSHSEPCDAMSQLMDINDISQISTNDQLNMISQLENKDEDLSSSGTETQADTQVDDVQGQFQSKESTLGTSVSSGDEIVTSPRSDSEVGSQISDLELNCRQALSSLETEEQPRMNALEETVAVDHETAGRKQDRPSSPDHFFPIFKKSKKNPRTEPLASNIVQLVLFGSAPQAKDGLISSRKRHNSLPDKVMGPPEVLSVDINPVRRHSCESMPTQETKSVKDRIHENWRRSFVPTSTPCRRTWKTQRVSSSPTGSPVTVKLPSPEMRTLNWKEKAQRHPSLKSSRFLFGRRKQEETMEKSTVPTNQPTDQERGNAENENCAPQKHSVLSFSVLPSTFNFKCGSNQRTDSNNPIPSK